MGKCVINIDWLQYSGKTSLDLCSVTAGLERVYTVERSKYGNKFFKQTCFLTLEKEPIATIMYEPHSGILDAKLVNIKIDNRLLYDCNLWKNVHLINELLYLDDINISRLDLCADFNTFANGMQPKDVIFNLANHYFRKVGKSKFSIYGVQTRAGLVYNGIRYGVHGSEIAIYLYNKSLELKTQTYKPYIVERWKDFGLSVDSVWRLEVSLHPKAKTYNDKESGVSYDLTLTVLETDMVNLYFLFALKSFRIVDILHYSGQNITRAPLIPLLNFEQSLFATSKLQPLYRHSNRSTYDKGIANYLNDFEQTRLYENNDLLMSGEDITILRRSSAVLRRLLCMNN